jgi:pyruvate/2-oxoglutarate dehydrogenase complex dihydrolipoamide dehydrogenase (E3) component
MRYSLFDLFQQLTLPPASSEDSHHTQGEADTMDLELKGKAAIVTGGSRGIGLAIGKALAAEGANVALVARNTATLQSAAAEITARGGGWWRMWWPPSGASTFW